MRIQHLKEYINLCIKFNTQPSWTGLNLLKEITKGA